MSTIPVSRKPDPAVASEGPVAVVAIHGVGQHPCGASADAVSTLLLSLGRDDRARKNCDKAEEDGLITPYSGFVTASIDVPLQRVQSPPADESKANDPHQPSPLSRIVGVFDERRGYLAALRHEQDSLPHGYKPKELRPNEPDRGEFAYQFMLTQVTGYKGDVDRDFQTVRLEGKREGNAAATNVHIYDAHYSDLTKPQSNIAAFFFAFFQLLFHLASLSLLAVYWVEAENVRAEAEKVKKNAEGEKFKKDEVGSDKEGRGKTGKKKGHIRRWRLESSVHAISVRLLIMWVPILNLVLLAVGCSAFLDKARGWAGQLPLGISFAAILGLIAIFIVLRKRGSPSRPFLWAAIPFFGAALGVLVLSVSAFLYSRSLFGQPSFPETLLLLDWLVAAGLLLGWIAKAFDPLRPGAFLLSIFLYLVNIAGFLLYLLPHAARLLGGDEKPLATASLWAVQWIFGELLLAWVLCLAFAFISWPLSWYCERGIENDAKRLARANAAIRTGRFAFAVPAILFVIVTCALWAGVVVYGSDQFKAFEGVTYDAAMAGPSNSKYLSYFIPSIPAVQSWTSEVSPAEKPADGKYPAPTATAVEWSEYLRGLLLVSVTPGLPITMALFAISLLLLTWAVLPSIIFEKKPEWVQNARSLHIRSLGEWLSRGLDNIAILTRVLWIAIVPVPLVFLAVDWYALHFDKAQLHALQLANHFTMPLIKQLGLVLAVSGAAIFGFILKYLTSILDAILDVDNYLRIFPEDQTPRACIAERIVSLLRYIAAYRDDHHRPYSKLIIVAHSLGSMVTTDLLRYLERSTNDCATDPGLARYGFRKKDIPKDETKLPIYVFSMGSPLRVLNRFFPHLYWWVSDVPDNSQEPLGAAEAPPIGIHSLLPRSDEMNVTHWSNAYRSGDYIGRWLWSGQWLVRNAADCTADAPDFATEKAPLECDERCIGLGAHTHYWDRSAPDIAAHLDELIQG